MAKSRCKSVWPPPVYVAQFANGESYRMSIAWQDGKPMPFDKGRRGACQIIANERARNRQLNVMAASMRAASTVYGPLAPPTMYLVDMQPAEPATDIVAAHIAWNDSVYPDPALAPEIAAPPRLVAVKPDPVARVLASIAKLSAAQLAAVMAALVPTVGFDDGERLAA